MSELTGAELDFAVAEAKGYVLEDRSGIKFWVDPETPFFDSGEPTPICSQLMWQPSTDGSQCMGLINRYKIEVRPIKNRDGTYTWYAGVYPEEDEVSGPTPLIAACRAIVAKEGE